MMSGRRHFLVVVLALATLFAGAGRSQAIVHEGLSAALEMAFPYVKKGFAVREDIQYGKLSVGKKKAVKYQLFKGNEYWFWLGSVTPDVKLSVRVYDKKGRPVDVETKVAKNGASARVLAPKTGTYYIVVRAVPADPKKKKEFKKDAVDWALIYGYR